MLGDDAPEKIRLIPDDYHLPHIGRLSDGRLFLVAIQLEFGRIPTRDYVCTFLFDDDGKLVDQTIDLVGERDSYPTELVRRIYDRHLEALGRHEISEIWLRPFKAQSHGVEFGFIADHDEEAGWRVEFMPGNTMCFWPPWDSGEYDT